MSPGTKVYHPSYGAGEVCKKAAHTHYDHVVVFFPNDPGKKSGSAGKKRRVLIKELEELK